MKIREIIENCEKTPGEVYSFVKSLSKCFCYDSKINTYFNFEDIENCRLKVYNLYTYMSDERRGIWLKTAYFDENLIAFWYCSGREGDDSYNGFILNKEEFIKGVKYLEEFYEKEEDYLIEFSIDEDIEELDYIYGSDMSKALLNVDLDLKYKVNDIVSLSIIEDKNKFPEIKEEVIRCQVISVDPKSTICCYTLKILDYKSICCFGKRDKKRQLFLKTDVLNYTDIFDTEIPFNDLNDIQKSTIIEYMNKEGQGTITLAYKEENKILNKL